MPIALHATRPQHRLRVLLGALLLAPWLCAAAADPIKIGVIGPLTECLGCLIARRHQYRPPHIAVGVCVPGQSKVSHLMKHRVQQKSQIHIMRVRDQKWFQ